jgi:hypothetical protein
LNAERVERHDPRGVAGGRPANPTDPKSRDLPMPTSLLQFAGAPVALKVRDGVIVNDPCAQVLKLVPGRFARLGLNCRKVRFERSLALFRFNSALTIGMKTSCLFSLICEVKYKYAVLL